TEKEIQEKGGGGRIVWVLRWEIEWLVTERDTLSRRK
ncbi:MAG: hypothetical protein ACI9D8_001067, partial [Reinekea sp.]